MKRHKPLKRVPFNPSPYLLRRRRGLVQQGKKKSDERKWQKTVRERDNYTCRRCGKYDLLNHAHHIATRKRRPDLKYEPSNGITLCFGCHSWVHDHPIEATEQGYLSDATYEKARRAA